MSSPRSTLGDKTKIHLFLMLAIVWVFTGLVGNSPWIPAESENVSMVMDIVSSNSIIAPLAAVKIQLIIHPYILSLVQLLLRFFHRYLLHMMQLDYQILYG